MLILCYPCFTWPLVFYGYFSHHLSNKFGFTNALWQEGSTVILFGFIVAFIKDILTFFVNFFDCFSLTFNLLYVKSLSMFWWFSEISKSIHELVNSFNSFLYCWTDRDCLYHNLFRPPKFLWIIVIVLEGCLSSKLALQRALKHGHHHQFQLYPVSVWH